MLDITNDSRAGWWVLALVLGGAVGFVLYTFVGTFVLGLFLYYAARPVYRRVHIRPPSLAAAVALLVLALPAVVLFGYTVALAVGELQAIVSSDLTVYEELLAPYIDIAGTTGTLQEQFATLLSDPEQLLQEANIQELLGTVTTSVTASLAIAFTGLLHLFVALALAFYLLRDGDRLADWTRTQVPDETLVSYGRAVDADLQTIFFGNILNALITGTIGAVVFSALSMIAPPEVPVPVPFLLGLLAGVASLVPVVGMKLVYVPVTLGLLVQSVLVDPATLWFPAVFLGVTVVVVDTVPDLVLRPYVSGRNLHVGAVMLAYVLGPLLFGWYGLFLGPLLLVVVADFARIVVPILAGTADEFEPVSLTGEPVIDAPARPQGDAVGVGNGGLDVTDSSDVDDGDVAGDVDEDEAVGDGEADGLDANDEDG